jgi:3-deoxy-D-manno-octulosonic-acid transferase
MSWLLNAVYALLLIAVAPVLVWRRFVRGKYRGGWGEKLLGRLPRREFDRPCLWFHAVSVGEVLQLRTILRQIAERRADVEIVVSTTTATGLAVARESFPHHTVCYFPLDFSWSVRRALARVRPTAVVLVELELWPNFVRHAADAGVPVLLVNGRISERSFRGYRRVRSLMRSLLGRLSVLAVQNATYAERLVVLGAPADRVCVTGSVKFDGVRTRRDDPATAEIGRSFGLHDGETVFVAGSTQSPEEELALETWLALRTEFPGLRLVLVPRHQERFDEVAKLVERRGLPLVRRSLVRGQGSDRRQKGQRQKAEGAEAESQPPAHHSPLTTHSASDPQPSTLNPQPAPVLLLDTLGELGACWGLADVAYVGGSMHVGRGGQNMIEPSAYGAAVLFGPDTRNFRDVVAMLLDADAARVVASPSDLTPAVRELLSDREQAAAQGRRAQELVLGQQGATARTVDEILRVLDMPAVPARRTAA